ncbi:hypothetical protein COBT_002660 [Conglomerata obtusa]
MNAINRINECADEMAKKEGYTGKQKIFQSYNNGIMVAYEYNQSQIIFKLLNCKVNIIRQPENKNTLDLIKFYKNNTCNNILKVYFCFSQNYNNEIIHWFITQTYTKYFVKFEFFHEDTIKEMCASICQGLYYLHEQKKIRHIQINTGTIVGVQQLSKYNEELLQVILQQMIYQLYNYNHEKGKEIFFDLPECGYLSYATKNNINKIINTTVEILPNYMYPSNQIVGGSFSTVAQATGLIFQNPKSIFSWDGSNHSVPETNYPQEDILYTVKIEITQETYVEEPYTDINVLVCNNKTWVRRIFQSDKGIHLSPKKYLKYIHEVSSYLKLSIPEKMKFQFSNTTFGIIDDKFNKAEFSSDDWKICRTLFCFTFKENELEQALNEQKISYVITGLESAIDDQEKMMLINSNDSYTLQGEPETNPLDYMQSYIDIKEFGVTAYELGKQSVIRLDAVEDKYYRIGPRNVFIENLMNRVSKENHDFMSNTYKDFVLKCFGYENEQIPSAKSLLSHPFINAEIINFYE